MTETTVDPFASPAEGQGDYVTLDDLGVTANLDGTATGRLVLIKPASIQTNIPGKPSVQQPNPKPYSAVYGELIVLDGPVNDKVPAVPMSFPDFRLHQGYIVTDVKGMFQAAGLVPAGRDSEYALVPKDAARSMLLGRLVKIKNKSNGFSWSISDGFTPAEADLARQYLASAPKPADPFA